MYCPHYTNFHRSSKGVVRARGLDHHAPMISAKALLTDPKALVTNPWVWAVLLIIPPTVLPGLDLTVSSWFYDAANHSFPAREADWAEWVRKQWPFYMLAVILGMAAVTAVNEITKRPRWGLNRLTLAYMLLCLAVGPGLLVNVVLKDHWGRPRPSTITQFGGPYDFRPPVLPGGPCSKNCSFPSGHSSLAFWTVAPASLVPARRRRPAIAAALGFGLLVGLVRIAEGGHFLSDVLYAGLITSAVTHILYRFMILPSTPRATKP